MGTKEEYYEGILETRRFVADPEVTKCACTHTLCDWHGKCKECVALHRHSGDHIPACLHPLIDEKIKALAHIAEILTEKKQKEPIPVEYWQYVKDRDEEQS